MPNWNDILKEREKAIEAAENALKRKVSRLQESLYSSLLAIITDLKTDPEGNILFTAGNISTTRKVDTVFSSFSKQVQKGFVGWLKNRVAELAGLNRRYINAVDSNFGSKGLEERALNILMKNLGYDVAKDSIIAGSWLDGLTSHNDVKLATFQRINSAMAGGMDMKTFKARFRADYSDGGSLGLLSRHYQGHVGNLFQGSDRTLSDIMAKEAKLDYFVYTGGIIATTRPFCKKHNGKVFHRSIFKKWDGETWVGKIKGAPTIQVGGGYGPCRHNWGWVTADTAARMIRAGRQHGLTDAQLQELYAKVKSTSQNA